MGGLDGNALLTSVLISTVGGGFFMYGRKQQRLPQLAAGIALMVYPYFVGNVLWMLVIAVLLMAALWLAVRAGF